MEIDIKKNKEITERIIQNYLIYDGRKGSEDFLKMLDATDYFIAPASTKYHLNVDGGLAAHTLSVYRTMLRQMVSMTVGRKTVLGEVLERLYDGEKIEDEEMMRLDDLCSEIFGNLVTFDSVVVVSFCHDLHKVNCYFKDEKRQKINNEWVSIPAFFIRDDKFNLGDSGTNSLYLAMQNFELTYDEALAIENHMGMHDNGTPLAGSSGAWKYSTLACMLHTADLFSTFVYER